MLFHAARAIGPFFAAVLLRLLDPGYCFLLNGLSFLAVLAALAWMDVPEVVRAATHTTLTGVREAFRYLLAHRGLFWLLVLSGGLALLSWPVISLLPAVSKAQIHAGPDGYPLMLSGFGGGALVRAFFVASLAKLHRR